MTLKKMIGVLAGAVGARFAGAGIGLLTQIVLARVMTQSDVGIVFMTMSAAAFISLFVIGGHALYASTELPRFLALKKQRLVSALQAAVLRDVSIALAIAALLLCLILSFLPLSPGLRLALIIGLICAPASGLLRYNSIVANSHRRYELSFVPDFIVRPGLLLLAILAVWQFAGQVTALHVVSAFAAIVIGVALWQAKRLGLDGLHPLHWNSFRQAFSSKLRGRALSLVIVSTVTLAFADIVMMIAGVLLPAEDVAVVGVTARLAALAGFVLQAAQSFILPDLTASMAVQQRDKTLALLWKTNVLTLVLSLAALITCLLLGEFALRIFGAPYTVGFTLLLVFLFGQMVRAIGGMNQQILALHGYQMRTASSCVIALLVLIAGSILLTRAYGMNGLGFAVILAEIVWLGALAWQAGRLCGLRGDFLWLLLNRQTKAGGH